MATLLSSNDGRISPAVSGPRPQGLPQSLTSTTDIARMSRLFAFLLVCLILKLVSGLAAVQQHNPVARASIIGLSFSPSTTTPSQPDVSVLGLSLVPLTTVTQTTTIYPASQPSSSSAISSDSSSSPNRHRGAIAGGVVAAVVIASIAVMLIVRFRNKHSPRHWRNRALEGRLQNLERKSPSSFNHAPPSAAYFERPYDGTNGTSLPAAADHPADPFVDNVMSPTRPLARLILHDKHRPSASDPFVDPHTSPGGASRGHHRGQSSFGLSDRKGSYHNQETFIEMDVNPSSPTKEKVLFA